MMTIVGWLGQLGGTLGTNPWTVKQIERSTSALSCARQAYSTWFPTFLVASRIGVGSGIFHPIASQGRPAVSTIIINDIRLISLCSSTLEALSK